MLIASSTLIGFMLKKGIGLNVFVGCLLYPVFVGDRNSGTSADYFHRRWFYQQLAENGGN